jgi:hypothetical protein
MANDIQLPTYPTTGNGTVLQLEAQRKKYRAAIESLQREITRAEDAFAASYEVSDQRASVRSRISSAAQTTRNRNLA